MFSRVIQVMFQVKFLRGSSPLIKLIARWVSLMVQLKGINGYYCVNLNFNKPLRLTEMNSKSGQACFRATGSFLVLVSKLVLTYATFSYKLATISSIKEESLTYSWNFWIVKTTRAVLWIGSSKVPITMIFKS